MIYFQAIFTTLWTIWNQRNTLVHEGKQPNPMEVILTAQNLSCRYQETPTKNADINRNAKESISGTQSLAGHWHLMIKIAGVMRKRARRSAYAYKAKNMQGESMFCGVASSAANSACGASQEAMVEASIKARNAGFHQVLILSNSRRLVHTVNKERNPNWQERTMMADLSSLHQNGFVLKMLFVHSYFVTNSLFSPFEWYPKKKKKMSKRIKTNRYGFYFWGKYSDFFSHFGSMQS